jgi:protein-S-isoprenylcysteine O-methyltransferase Ste14
METHLIIYPLLIQLSVLIGLVIIRAVILRKHGINAIVFGDTNKSDFFLIPVVLFFIYALFVPIFNLPFIDILLNTFWNIDILDILATLFRLICIIWIIFTLHIFGNSFRIGIDEKTEDKLITTGTFAISRNPIYIAFIGFFFGAFLSYPNIITLLFLIFLSLMIHIQILREEEFLKNHYGKEYDEYTSKVRRYF